MPNMQYKDLLFSPVSFDPVEGVIKGYASVMGNIDQGKDVIPMGAFLKTIRERGADAIKIGWQHNVKHPLGVTTVIKEVPRSELPADILKMAPDATGGLYVEGRAIKTGKNVDRLKLMAEGGVTGLSIGYEAVQEEYKEYKGQHVRMLPEIKLWEWSPVTFAMNNAAQTTVVKGDAIDKPTLMAEVEQIVKRAFTEHDAKGAGTPPPAHEEPVMPAAKAGRRHNHQDEQHLHAAIGHIAAALGTGGAEPSDQPDELDNDSTAMTPSKAALVGSARSMLDTYVKARLAPKAPTSADSELAAVAKIREAMQLIKDVLVMEATEFAAGSPDETWGMHCLTEAISQLECFCCGEEYEAVQYMLGKKAGLAEVAAKGGALVGGKTPQDHDPIDGSHSHAHDDAGVSDGGSDSQHEHAHTHAGDNLHMAHSHQTDDGTPLPLVTRKSGMDEGEDNLAKPPRGAKPGADAGSGSMTSVNLATGTDAPPAKTAEEARERKERELARRLKIAALLPVA